MSNSQHCVSDRHVVSNSQYCVSDRHVVTVSTASDRHVGSNSQHCVSVQFSRKPPYPKAWHVRHTKMTSYAEVTSKPLSLPFVSVSHFAYACTINTSPILYHTARSSAPWPQLPRCNTEGKLWAGLASWQE